MQNGLLLAATELEGTVLNVKHDSDLNSPHISATPIRSTFYPILEFCGHVK